MMSDISLFISTQMRKLLIFLLFISGSTLKAVQSDTICKIDEGGKRQGWWVLYGRDKKDPAYDLTAKWQEGKYKDSQKIGSWVEYFPTGSKKSELIFVNNRPNGHAIIYNENGKKSEEGTWVGSKWVGSYTLYYDNGTPRESFNYSQLGQREGVQTYTHPNGKVAITVEMKCGKEQGWKKEYDENGNLIRETYFDNGEIDVSKTKIYDSPIIVEKAPEEKVIKGNSPTVSDPSFVPNKGIFDGEGDWILYKNGQITMKGTFHLKKLVDGEERIYDPNGLLISIKIYKGGKYVGEGTTEVK